MFGPGEAMDFSKIDFIISVHRLNQLPEPLLPEIAFAGRSNVGKSSLINTLTKRKGLVKVSGKPGKTQGLNYFKVADSFYLVDLPGYGYAKVPRKMQEHWQTLISSYIEKRETLKCVVVILDIRHEPKNQDSQLISWLKQVGVECLPVYTKIDKVSGTVRGKNSRMLDIGHGILPDERVLFSAKTGQGRAELVDRLQQYLVT